MNNLSRKNKNIPFFSVIVPVYNKEEQIHRSINSVFNQTYQDFELILIDDASTDNSGNEMSKFRDSRISILKRSKPGPGGYAARNLGAVNAKAKWLAFLDADDSWEKKHLHELHELISNFPQSGIVGTSWTEYYDNQFMRVNKFRENCRIQNSMGITYDEYIKLCAEIGGPFCTSVVAIKKNILLEAGGFPEGKCNRGGDVDTWLRVIAYSGKSAWSPKLTANYYRTSTNSVTSKEAFTGNWERKTIDNLLSNEYNKKNRRHLKVYLNKRLMDRYLISKLANMKSVDKILPNIFLRNLNLKHFIILVFSVLPNRFRKFLYNSYKDL